MKAKPFYGMKFVLKKEITDQRKNLKDTIKSLRLRSRLNNRVKRMTFPCELRYTISSSAVAFSPPQGGWKNDREFHKSLASIVTQFGVRMERNFSEYSGTYTWRGAKDGFHVTLDGAVKPENCEIVPYQDTVTKYRSVCGKADTKTIT